MSKKNTGLLVAFGAVLGAAAVGAAYYLRYKAFHDELDEDFHDYEEESEDEEEPERTYVTLNPSKDADASEDVVKEAPGQAEAAETAEADTAKAEETAATETETDDVSSAGEAAEAGDNAPDAAPAPADETDPDDPDNEIEVVFENIPISSGTTVEEDTEESHS